MTRTAGREGETRFYYSGMAQAVLLDRLLPGWKERAFEPEVMQEDLLREAAEAQGYGLYRSLGFQEIPSCHEVPESL